MDRWSDYPPCIWKPRTCEAACHCLGCRASGAPAMGTTHWPHWHLVLITRAGGTKHFCMLRARLSWTLIKNQSLTITKTTKNLNLIVHLLNHFCGLCCGWILLKDNMQIINCVWITVQARCARDTRGFLSSTYSPLVTRSEKPARLGQAGPGGDWIN